VQTVIVKVLLNKIPFVPKAYYEFVDTKMGKYFHDMPDDGPTANFHHRLGAEFGFFAKARPETASQNHGLSNHCISLIWQFPASELSGPVAPPRPRYRRHAYADQLLAYPLPNGEGDLVN
jgi:hypothetical protein